jgi:hypothetical protein
MNSIVETLNFRVDINELRQYYHTLEDKFDHLCWSFDRYRDSIIPQWKTAAYANPANLLTYGWAIQSNLNDLSLACPPWDITTDERVEYRNTPLAFGIIEKLQIAIPYGYRWAISVQPPGGVVSLHSDQEDEYTVWIPIYTNGTAITFVTDCNIDIELESNGSAYLLNTTVPHHTHNSSNISRATIIFRMNKKHLTELRAVAGQL